MSCGICRRAVRLVNVAVLGGIHWVKLYQPPHENRKANQFPFRNSIPFAILQTRSDILKTPTIPLTNQ